MAATSPPVMIIGAGTGGLALAHGLKRAGLDVRVFERDEVRTDGLHGYRVGIDPDGSRALHALLPPDLYDVFVATCARAPKYFCMLTERLSEVLTLDLPPITDPVESEKSVSRMTLRQVLLTGLDDVVRFGSQFTGYHHHPDGTVTARFADGSSATGDLLVAADGTGSRVRQQYLPQAQLIDTGVLAVAGKLPITEESRALLPPRVFNGISMVNGPRGSFCILHVMEFPWDRDGLVRHGIGGNDERLLRTWPGLRFDNTRDYINWGFSLRADRFPVGTDKLRGTDLAKVVLDLTPDWHPQLRRLFELTEPSTCFPVPILTSEPVPAWTPSPITLLGDAVHTMTPGRGVGANTALRDAAVLCAWLLDVRDGRSDLVPAVGAYEERMREYAYPAVIASRKQISGDDPIHRPVIGRALLAGMRTAMRVVDRTPPLKRRMTASMLRFRGADRDAAEFSLSL